MARISSTTLFNFTDSIDFLIDNLRKGFFCSNTYEKLPCGNNGYKVPMACFCDIPLSLIKEHFDWYGKYGIGIKRSYAREHGVKPVWYVTSENQFLKEIVKVGSITEHEKKHLLPYLKQFIGKQLYIKTGEEKQKKFYDEREWRFIPEMSLIQPFFGVRSNRERRTVPQNGFRMELDLNVVEYIIIQSEKDFIKILDELKKLSEERGIKYETLISKIITASQIEKDF